MQQILFMIHALMATANVLHYQTKFSAPEREASHPLFSRFPTWLPKGWPFAIALADCCFALVFTARLWGGGACGFQAHRAFCSWGGALCSRGTGVSKWESQSKMTVTGNQWQKNAGTLIPNISPEGYLSFANIIFVLQSHHLITSPNFLKIIATCTP